jgi:hypothetical protein
MLTFAPAICTKTGVVEPYTKMPNEAISVLVSVAEIVTVTPPIGTGKILVLND